MTLTQDFIKITTGKVVGIDYEESEFAELCRIVTEYIETDSRGRHVTGITRELAEAYLFAHFLDVQDQRRAITGESVAGYGYTKSRKQESLSEWHELYLDTVSGNPRSASRSTRRKDAQPNMGNLMEPVTRDRTPYLR